MKTKHLVYALLSIGIIALITYRIISNREGSNPGQKSGPSIATVTGIVAVPEKFADNLLLSGTIEANEQVEIRSEITGVVNAINFKEGTEVSKGQVLLRVNDIELRAQLSKVETAKELASENERRAKLLLKKQAISQEDYDVASAGYKSAQAEAQLISAQLGKATIRAPFSGTIGLRYISEGTYVTPSTPIASLVNTKQLKITFSIPEKYASRIQLNSELSFTTSGSKTEYSAKIYAVEPQIDVATRTLKMRAIAENPEGKLYPGMFASVILPLETVDDAILVPSEALIPIQNGKMIFISEGGKAKQIKVETGSRTGSSVRILSGLKAGDTILTSGVMSLKDGVAVKVKFEESNKTTGI
ncbi:MAG: efflux RND transporter periplasmic adaptor subunit [Aequorivita sp.]